MKEVKPEPVAKLSIIQEQTDPIQWLEREIQVDFAAGPETMRISLRGDNTREMLLIVNAVTKAYLNAIVDKEKNKRLDRLEQLKQTFVILEEKRQAKKRTLEDVIEAPLKQAALDLNELKDDLARADIVWKKVANEIDKLELAAPPPLPRIQLLEGAVITDEGRSSTRLSMIVLGGLGCFALVCLAFTIWESLANRENQKGRNSNYPKETGGAG